MEPTDPKKIFEEYFKKAIEYMGERAAYDNADIQRDKALENLLIKKGILTKEEIENETAKNMLEVIAYIEEQQKPVISPIQNNNGDLNP